MSILQYLQNDIPVLKFTLQRIHILIGSKKKIFLTPLLIIEFLNISFFEWTLDEKIKHHPPNPKYSWSGVSNKVYLQWESRDTTSWGWIWGHSNDIWKLESFQMVGISLFIFRVGSYHGFVKCLNILVCFDFSEFRSHMELHIQEKVTFLM